MLDKEQILWFCKEKESPKQSSRSGNESFLTYFRFRSSHTTVRAVRHTAV